MSGRRQWRGGSDGRQDDQWATVEDDVLTSAATIDYFISRVVVDYSVD